MTAIQIYALIGLIVLAGLLVWAGYFMGHNDGMSAGMKESDAIQLAESVKTIRELKVSSTSSKLITPIWQHSASAFKRDCHSAKMNARRYSTSPRSFGLPPRRSPRSAQVKT